MSIDIKQGDSSPINEEQKFGKGYEIATVSLAFDQPEFFSIMMPYLKVDFFEYSPAAKYVFALIKFYYDKHGIIASRAIIRDEVSQAMTADDSFEDVLKLVDRESDAREVPIVTARLSDFAKKKAYGQLYSEAANAAYERGDFDAIEKIIEEAKKITLMNTSVHDFFAEMQGLFIERVEDRFTTGFASLDRIINEGGPVRKDTFCFMAPTNTGKSIALANTGAINVKRGQNVVHITLEDGYERTAARYMGCLSGYPIREKQKYKDEICSRLLAVKTNHGGNLLIASFPPDDITVDTIHALLDSTRKLHGIKADVVIVDYLELMLSRVPAYNKDEYIKQKRVSTEICRLAVKEDVFAVTASQTNRSGLDTQDSKNNDKVIDLNKAAESFGKTMPLSYIVTINQTKSEYEGNAPQQSAEDKPKKQEDKPVQTSATMRFYIAKNRNGPKFTSLGIRVNYATMVMQDTDYICSVKDENIIEDSK